MNDPRYAAAPVPGVSGGSPRGTIQCSACGRRLQIWWPVRSLVCSCGVQLLPPGRSVAPSPSTSRLSGSGLPATSRELPVQDRTDTKA